MNTDSDFAPPRKRSLRVKDDMSTIGLLLYFTGCARLHKDGNAFGYVFRPWHPITWIVWIVMVLPCAITGEKVNEIVRMRLSDYWLKKKNEIKWVTPWTRIEHTNGR